MGWPLQDTSQGICGRPPWQGQETQDGQSQLGHFCAQAATGLCEPQVPYCLAGTIMQPMQENHKPPV